MKILLLGDYNLPGHIYVKLLMIYQDYDCIIVSKMHSNEAILFFLLTGKA